MFFAGACLMCAAYRQYSQPLSVQARFLETLDLVAGFDAPRA